MGDIHIHFRVAIVGAQPQRVAKVISLLSNSTLEDIHDDAESYPKRRIHAEYIPCVATFDTYENEKGENVKYLVKIEHHGPNGRGRGGTLAPFFDEIQNNSDDDTDVKDGECIRIPGIAAVAIGCGIEKEDEVFMISDSINQLSRLCRNATEGECDEDILVTCIQPNQEYASMKEETMAYKNLSPEEKEHVTEEQTIGPGKMVKFTMELAARCIPPPPRPKEEEARHCTLDDFDKGEEENDDDDDKPPPPPPMPKIYDENQTRFACKMCRTILFAQTDLEDPPHTAHLHSFSSRKTKSGSNNTIQSKCQSAFLATGLNWMGDISASFEGKLSCPNQRCGSKLGYYKWHGTQCNCGTWVTPAIMIHLSRVDILPPENQRKEINPLARLHVGGTLR